MALTKDQQKYLIARIDALTQTAYNAVRAKPNKQNPNLVAALEKAGFIVKQPFYINDYIGIKGEADPYQVERDAQAAIGKRARAAKDSIMLGDSEDALAVLAQLEKDFA